MLQEEQMLVGMTAIKDYDDYTYYHSVNVSILSVALGMKLGLNKKRLSELGIAAFLHDIGKMNISGEILNKSTPFSNEEWEILKSHPSEGVKMIVSSMKMDPVTIRSAIVSFEHHLNYNCSGYPSIRGTMQLDLYSNIITIADRFDTMTAGMVYDRIPIPPEEALRILAEKAGKDIDPALLKIFIRMTGYFPIGTMVMLDTCEMGIVCRVNADMPDRPVIILLFDTQKIRVKNVIVDLAEKGQGGNYLRTIKKTVDPYQYGINISEYLLEANT
jgi:putative nucleotidyltransferase with HDIG domain